MDTTEHKEEKEEVPTPEVIEELPEDIVVEEDQEIEEAHHTAGFEEGADRDSEIEEGQESEYGI